MRVLFPFDRIDINRWDRYKRQLEPIAKRVDEFHILSEVQLPSFPYDRIDNIYFHYLSDHLERVRFGNKYQKLMIKGFDYVTRVKTTRDKAYKVFQEPIDVIYGLSGSGYIQYFMLDMKKRLNVPIVFRIRGHGIRERSIKQRFPKRQFNDVLDLYSTRNFDYYIPINWELYQLMYKRNVDINRISMPVGLGIDNDMFFNQHIERDDTITVGYAGRLSKEKGFDFLLHLMNKVDKNKFTFLVCGKKQMQIKDFPDNCVYLGEVEHSFIPNFINFCDIMVLPSLTEGLSNLILESWACERVLITSPFAIPKELPRFGFKAYDMHEWMNTLNNLDIDDLIERGKRAREYSEHFSWDSFGEKIVRILEGVSRK